MRDTNPVARPKRLAPGSPAAFRLGAGCCGGFLTGFLFRRFVKFTALVAAAVLAAIAALKFTGVIDLDWASIEAQVHESRACTYGKLAGLKTLVTGYLPSALATAIGGWRGLWWKSTISPASAK